MCHRDLVGFTVGSEVTFDGIKEGDGLTTEATRDDEFGLDEENERIERNESNESKCKS